LNQYRQLQQTQPGALEQIWWHEIKQLFTDLKRRCRIEVIDSQIGKDGFDMLQYLPKPRTHSQ
jgi:hypothetical protein